MPADATLLLLYHKKLFCAKNFASEPFPEDLRTLNRPGEVSAHAITAQVFQAIWNQAQELPDGFMGMFA